MNGLLALCFAILGLYILRVAFWIKNWVLLTKPKNPSGFPPNLPISIIVAARNEAANIGNLLTCLQAQDYPTELTEIIIVDDHSSDDTLAIVKQFTKIKLLQLENSNGKKAAIEVAVKSASGILILCTDADCLPPQNWVSSIASFYEETKAQFISGPVSLIKANQSFASAFDEIESAVLVAIGGASIAAARQPTMCNGANIAYTKTAFEAVGGYTGNEHIASGDDEFLMQKIAKKYPGNVYFLKDADAIVSTPTCINWKTLFAQRTRWASKHKHYQSTKLRAELLIILLANLSLVFMLIGCFLNWFHFMFALLFIFLKLQIDLALISSSFGFFGKQVSIVKFCIFQLLYPFYLIAVGIAANFFSYSWKGRKVKTTT